MSQAIQIDFKWADYQRDIVDELENGEYDIIIQTAGFGGGKSYTGGQWIHFGVLTGPPGGESLVLAQDRTKGESTTYRVFFETLPGVNTVPDDSGGDPENSPIVAGWHGSKYRLTYENGHVVWLGGADRWNRFAGAEFRRIWVDEVAHYKCDLYALHEMLTTRQRTDEGPNTTLWTSTGDGYNQLYDITERQVDADDEPLTWKDRMKWVRTDTRDNPFLDDESKERIVAQFEGTERAEQGLAGGFAAAKGLVYSNFSRSTHVVDSTTCPELTDRRIYGYDYGWDNPRVLLEGAWTFDDRLVIVDEYYKTEEPVEDCVAWARGKKTGEMWCDHDPEHIDKFTKAGFDAGKASKSIDEGIDEVRSLLKPDDPGLFIHERCTNTIQEILGYKEEHVGKRTAKDHAMDALRYLVMGDEYADSSQSGGTGTW